MTTTDISPAIAKLASLELAAAEKFGAAAEVDRHRNRIVQLRGDVLRDLRRRNEFRTGDRSLHAANRIQIEKLEATLAHLEHAIAAAVRRHESLASSAAAASSVRDAVAAVLADELRALGLEVP